MLPEGELIPIVTMDHHLFNLPGTLSSLNLMTFAKRSGAPAGSLPPDHLPGIGISTSYLGLHAKEGMRKRFQHRQPHSSAFPRDCIRRRDPRRDLGRTDTPRAAYS
jgi:hypothetical protein